jgi:hypothetical protein
VLDGEGNPVGGQAEHVEVLGGEPARCGGGDLDHAPDRALGGQRHPDQ